MHFLPFTHCVSQRQQVSRSHRIFSAGTQFPIIHFMLRWTCPQAVVGLKFLSETWDLTDEKRDVKRCSVTQACSDVVRDIQLDAGMLEGAAGRGDAGQGGKDCKVLSQFLNSFFDKTCGLNLFWGERTRSHSWDGLTHPDANKHKSVICGVEVFIRY